MVPTRILLDLDDVCNRFTMYALKHVGCPVDEFDYRDYDPAWGWDIIRAANALHPSRQFTPAEFWDSIGRDVWASVPESAEFKTLLRRCEALVGSENVCTLYHVADLAACLRKQSLAMQVKIAVPRMPVFLFDLLVENLLRHE